MSQMQPLSTFLLEITRDGIAVVFLLGVVGLSCVALGG
jgi:hypothetical protein